jgi:hypothetical protein
MNLEFNYSYNFSRTTNINNIDNDITYEIEINENVQYHYPSYCQSNEEKIIRKKLNELLSYCEFVVQKDEFQDKMNMDDIEMEYHVNFLLDKLCYILCIFEKYVEIELKKEYKSYQFILSEVSLNDMINVFISKDIHFQDSKNMLIKLYNIIDIININKIFEENTSSN